MRTPGMTLMRMPMFTWSILITTIIIIFAFPVLTVALALMTFDRLFDAHFFTMASGGMPMLWANLFWVWGHPEVYIVILPAFGIFSEIISTFSRKRLFGYSAMVYSMVAISLLSFVVWLHHFFTMGAVRLTHSSRFRQWRFRFQPGLRSLTGCLHCIKDVFVLQFQCFGHWHLFQTS